MTLVRSGARGASTEETFRGLFSQHYGAIHAYCARRLGTSDAADAASDVFTVCWRKIRRVPGEPETLPWLYGVARNVVANHRRSRLRRARLDARTAAHADHTWTDQPGGFDAVLAQMSDDDCEVLMLVAWEGLGPQELGRALGCSANAATVRLYRARTHLSAAWDAVGGGA